MKLAKCHIILVGFKHTGKTTVGKQLAVLSKRNFIDLDRCIENVFPKRLDCREIMEEYGSDFFRALERSSLNKLIDCPPAVIALGGETVIDLENRILIKNHFIIHITAPKTMVFDRIMDHGLPAYFSKNESPRLVFNQLWDKQNIIYQELTSFVVNNAYTVEAAVNTMVKKLSKA